MKSFSEAFIFPGSNIYYPILSLISLFLYIAFSYNGEYYVILKDQTPMIPFWWILAVISFFTASLWGYGKSISNKEFSIIGTILFSVSFFIIFYKVYKSYLGLNQYYMIAIEAVVSLLCLSAFVFPSNKRAWLWLFPVALMFGYNIFPIFIYVVLASSILITILCIFCIKPTKGKYLYIICVLFLYLLTTWIYLPLNPLNLTTKLNSIYVSENPRTVSLITEANSKFSIVDGSSFNGHIIADAKFDTFKDIDPYRIRFVGFKDKLHNSNDNIDTQTFTLFPLIPTDSCIYFTSDIKFYHILDSLKTSSNIISKLTAQIYYDYIDLFQSPDSITQKNITERYIKLQEELTKLSTDSLLFREFENKKIEPILRNFTLNMTLGILNAISLDLIEQKRYKNAVNLFSFQFFLAFLESPIYRNINTTINFDIISDEGNKKISIKDQDLKSLDKFKPWAETLSTASSLAYFHSNSADQIAVSIKNILNQYNFDEPEIFFDINSIKSTQEIIRKVQSLLLYPTTPHIRDYSISLQLFLYHCYLQNYIPDYNSFFLNRFYEISMIVPLNPSIMKLHNDFIEFNKDQYELKINKFKDIHNYLGQIDSMLNVRKKSQEEINSKVDTLINAVGLPVGSKDILKKTLFKMAKDKETKDRNDNQHQ